MNEGPSYVTALCSVDDLLDFFLANRHLVLACDFNLNFPDDNAHNNLSLVFINF